MPFLQLAISQTAGSHLSRPSGESSKMVPTLSENFRFGCLVLHSQPDATIEVDGLAAAGRAGDAVRPATGNHEFAAVVGVGEEFDGFEQGAGRDHHMSRTKAGSR